MPQLPDLAQTLRRYPLTKTLRNLTGFFFARLEDTQIKEVASSMTLTTLLSLIPLLAVSLAVFAAFPTFASSRAALEAMILESFLPPQYSEQIVHYLQVFMTQASGLGIFGLAGLAVTALLLIDKFFVTLNSIFKVRRMRPWPQRALIYWGMLTLAPAAIFLSLTMSKQAIEIAMGNVDAPGFLNTFYFCGQVLLQGLGYAVLYKFVPNCHVPARNAVIGGLTVAVVGQLVKVGFETYVTAGTLSNIYGAFVALPVFLLWLYVTWLLVFSGAAITATIPLLFSGRYADSYKRGNDYLTGVALLKVLLDARRMNRPAVPTEILCSEVDTYPEAAERILHALAQVGYCAEVNAEKKTGGRWVLLCDPEKKNLRDALHVLLVDQTNRLVTPRRERIAREEGMLYDWYRDLRSAPALMRPLSEVFPEAAPEGGSESRKDGVMEEKGEEQTSVDSPKPSDKPESPTVPNAR